LAAALLMLFKAFKDKLYTNKFNDKDLFTAKKLFKNNIPSNEKMKNKHKEVLKVIKEDDNESYDVESIRYRASCETTSEKRNSNNKESFERGSYAFNSHIDGERLQTSAKRSYKDRNSNDEPEIMSVFSTDKSSDYAVKPRKYMKVKYGQEDEYKPRDTLAFGYEKPTEFKTKTKKTSKANDKETKDEVGVQDLKIKFNFTDDESDDEDDIYSSNGKDIDLNTEFGRQTIDLNGPIYDQNVINQNENGYLSEVGNPESEVDDMNKLLEQMENKSFKGFRDSDLGNSIDEKLNEGLVEETRLRSKGNIIF